MSQPALPLASQAETALAVPDGADHPCTETGIRVGKKRSVPLPELQRLVRPRLFGLRSMQTAYGEAWWNQPIALQHALLRCGWTPMPADGVALWNYLNMCPLSWTHMSTEVWENIEHAWQENLEPTFGERMTSLAKLGGRITIQAYGNWALQDQVREELLSQTTRRDADHVQAIVNKWKKWKPRKTERMPIHSRLLAERELSKKWRQRIVSHFLPFAAQIPKLNTLQAEVGHLLPEEAQSLLGDRRLGSLRNHCLSIEKILQMDPQFIPWTESKIRDLLRKLTPMENAQAKINRAWRTLKLFTFVFGIEDIDWTSLEAKKDVILMEQVEHHLKKSNRAIPPTFAVISGLERIAAEAASPIDKLVAALFRFMAGASARFDDVQHTQPGRLIVTDKTVEAEAWQTKTMKLGNNTKKPSPLVAAKCSLTGFNWWDPLIKIHADLKKKWGKDIDYMLPKVQKDLSSFIMEPAPNQHALTILQNVMARHNLPAQDITKISLHSFRVWLPDLAYQSDVPRDQRAYLGRWAVEQTADRYVRDHRHAVLSIWDTVTKKPIIDSTEPLAVDKASEVWGEDEPADTAEGPPTVDSIPETQDGPGMLVKYRTGRLVHCLLQTARTLCGRTPTPANASTLTWEEYNENPWPTCSKCFKLVRLPARCVAWDDAGDSAPSESVTESESDSSESSTSSEES